MAKSLVQTIKFKARADDLYQIYMDPAKHATAISSTVSLEPVVGGKFSVFDTEGCFLLLVEDQTIVQTWRAKNWDKRDRDSILILNFSNVRGGSELDIVHAYIPDYDYRHVQEGWLQYYWLPWKKYLAKLN